MTELPTSELESELWTCESGDNVTTASADVTCWQHFIFHTLVELTTLIYLDLDYSGVIFTRNTNQKYLLGSRHCPTPSPLKKKTTTKKNVSKYSIYTSLKLDHINVNQLFSILGLPKQSKLSSLSLNYHTLGGGGGKASFSQLLF